MFDLSGPFLVLEINDLKGQAARGPSLINPDSVGASQFNLKIVLHFRSHAPSLPFTENRSVRLRGLHHLGTHHMSL